MSAGWPKWIDIRYYDDKTGGIYGYTGCANNREMLFEMVDRLKIKEYKDYIFMRVNEELQSDEAVMAFYTWMEKKRKERFEDEERKKSEEAAENRNKK